MSGTVLQMTGISKAFGGIQALDNVDLRLKRGEVLGLVGENGAGKSTLMKILSGIEIADTGSIVVDGVEQAVSSPKKAKQLGIGMIPQELILVHGMTVLENLFLGREATAFMGFLRRNEMYEKAGEVLKALGSSIDPDETVRVLPKADQQIVAIARLILEGGRIVILDEPTSSLTEKEIKKLFAVIRKACGNGASAIYISHRLEEVVEICDRVMVLRDGHHVITTEPNEPVNKQQLIRHMVGAEIAEEFPHTVVGSGKEILHVDNLMYRTNQGKTVEHIGFTLHEGEVLGITGLVGVGKTELGQTLMGLKKPLSGRISLDGKDVSIDSPVEAFKMGFGYVSEDRRGEGLVLGLQSIYNMTLSSMRTISKGPVISFTEEKKAGRKYLADLTMKENYLRMNANQLSGGNQQKIVIIRQMLSNARVIIFDEPTKGIDVAAKSEIAKLISDLCGRGKAVLLLSSEPREVLGISDRVIILTSAGMEGPFERGVLDYTQLMAIELEGATA